MYARLKRYGDALAAACLLIVFSWAFLLIGLAFLLCGEHPIFFRQARIGLDGIPFVMIKFRTLLTNENLPLEQRTFKLGNFLRRSGLDELPQLCNVLTGKMSLVGPRPLPVEYASLFTPQEWRRHKVRPGITGWAQVHGRHQIPWRQKLLFDCWYVDHQSFAVDLKILFKTLLLVLSFPPDRSLKEEKFKGT
ncbi:MAG: sugar transferase [Bacteroidota bacterium]